MIESIVHSFPIEYRMGRVWRLELAVLQAPSWLQKTQAAMNGVGSCLYKLACEEECPESPWGTLYFGQEMGAAP
jgi:hypothetical protein